MTQDTRAHQLAVAPSDHGSLSGRVGRLVRSTLALPNGMTFHITCTDEQLAEAKARIRAAFVKVLRRRKLPRADAPPVSTSHQAEPTRASGSAVPSGSPPDRATVSNFLSSLPVKAKSLPRPTTGD